MTTNKRLTVLITGGAGFIGSELGYILSTSRSQSLEEVEYNVILLDDMSYGREENLLVNGVKIVCKFIKCDIRSEEMYNHLKDVDIVIHCAGIAPLPDCQVNPAKAIDVNVSGLANTLEASRRNNIKRFIFFSSSAVYENNNTFPSKESDNISPSLIYACSKQQGEILCHSYRINYNMPIVILRCFNVYGPHQNLFRKHPPFLGYAIRELMNGNVPTFYSDGTQKRDYIFIDDLVRLVQLCMLHKSAPGNTFNASTNKVYSVNELYQIVSEHFDFKCQPNYNNSSSFWNKYPELFESGSITMPLRGDIVEKEVKKFAQGDYSHAQQVLGWIPLVSMEKGIEITVRHILDHKDQVKE